MKPLKLAVIFLCMLFVSISSSAYAVPSFNSGFTGWEGQLSGVDVLAVDPATDAHFSLNGNKATLTYADLTDPYWTFSLSQLMTADPLQGTGYRLLLSFYMQVGLGDGVGNFDNHIVSATLGSDALVDTTDTSIQNRLLNGDTFTLDITNYAGSTSLLAFSIGDLDLSVTDYLTIGDFAFSQVAPLVDPPNSPVPEPGTIYLVGAGLAGIAIVRNRKKASL